MTLEIFLTLAVICLTLVAFFKEWGAADIISLSVLCLLVILGLLDVSKLTEVFKNDAPVTIAALFVIGGALEKTGGVEQIARLLRARLNGSTRSLIFFFASFTAFFSAWMNNTAIVALLLPVALGLARSRNISSSKILMPLSYASILGGCCTLIGTSTNLVVNASLKVLGEPPLGMFELTKLGVPLAVIGILYLTFFGNKIIPDRSSVSGTLQIDYRTVPLYHLLITSNSPLIGSRFNDTPLAALNGLRVLEIRRDGQRIMTHLNEVTIERFDRFLVAINRPGGKNLQPSETFQPYGAEILSTIEGIVTELVITDESDLVGGSLAESDFRQHFNALVVTVHRNGRNITDQMAKTPLEHGDTLLVITPRNNLQALADSKNFILTDNPETTPLAVSTTNRFNKKAFLAWLTLLGVVVTATLSEVLRDIWPGVPVVPIHFAALVGALAVVWMKLLTPREAYAAIDWPILFMLFGLLGLGLAMQSTGTAAYLATLLATNAARYCSPDILPYATLAACYLLTLVLTEVLSNNATALMMTPIMVKMAEQMQVNPRPFVIAVTIAASAAFALPMGYQTHMMIYGPGGYRFSDFLRVGIPLNIMCWVAASLLIPVFWPF